MRCVVTAGPTVETLDEVRRLTNVSTGRLGMELANHLTARGHAVTLLLGEFATWRGESFAQEVERFGSVASLRARLRKFRRENVEALFHAAAVSDFTFGKVWARSADGLLTEERAGKISSRGGGLLAELVPTPKIIAELRDWFPKACLVGWKYEVDGDRETAIRAGEAQLAACRTDACVVNGPAYGTGFGLVRRTGSCLHVGRRAELFVALENCLLS